MDDQQILGLYLERSETAIAETAKKYNRYCNKIAFNILHSQEDVEECVSDTYLKAWDSIPPNEPQSLAAFLGKITRNLSLNRWKLLSAQKRGGGQMVAVLSELEECVAGADTIESSLEEKELTRTINTFLKAQPKESRKIFVKRYWYLHSVAEISEQMGISQSKVKSALFRTRNKLKDKLQKEGITI